MNERAPGSRTRVMHNIPKEGIERFSQRVAERAKTQVVRAYFGSIEILFEIGVEATEVARRFEDIFYGRDEA